MPQILIDDLKKAIREDKAVLFIGSGVSIAATGGWNVQPCASWKGLLKNGLEFVKGTGIETDERRLQGALEDIESDNLVYLLAGAHKIEQVIRNAGEGEFRKWLQDSIGQLELRSTELIEHIAALGLPMVTTNYDNLIEQVTNYSPVHWLESAKVQAAIREKGSNKVVHLHGYYEDPESIILDPSGYARIVNHAPSQNILKTLQTAKTIIYIGLGAGLEDPNFSQFRKWASSLFEGSQYRHFRLCRTGELESLKAEHGTGERVMLVPYGDNHNDLPGFIAKLGGSAPKPQGRIASASPSPHPKALTDIIPRREKSSVIGREARLKELRQVLEQGQQIAVVNGMGGIGKTTLAETYLGEYFDDYQHIAWITQKNEDFKIDILRQEYLLESLGIEPAGSDPQATFLQVIRGLRSIPGTPNLLVIDNASKSIEKYITAFPKGPQWHLLITTRSELEDIPMLRLDTLGPQEALQLFQKYCQLPYKQKALQELLRKIEYHTLTIELLAKTADQRRLSMEQLQQAILQDQETAVASSHNRKQEKIRRIGSYLSRVFALLDLSQAQKAVLSQWACLPNFPIPFSTLESLFLTGDQEKDQSLGLILHQLAEKGLLQRDREKDTYKIHALTADIAWKDLHVNPKDVAHLIKNISEQLSIDQTKDNPVETFVWEPFGRSIELRYQTEQSPEVARLQNNLALVLKALGDYSAAQDLLEKAMHSYEKNFDSEHPNTAVSYSNLALVLQDLGDYSAAQDLLEKVVHSAEKNFGSEHPTTAVRYSNLAMVLQALGDYSAAKDLLEKAMHSDEKNFGSEHPTTAVSYSNLAMVLQDLGNYAAAQDLLEKAMYSDEKNFGSEHPTTAVRYWNLAMVLKDLGNDTRAKELLEKALAVFQSSLPVGHPYINTVKEHLQSLPDPPA